MSVLGVTHRDMRKVFLGSEAVAHGALSAHELRRWHRPIFRDVYMPKQDDVTLLDRIERAWLRSGRRGIIAGVAASALHGASWVDADIPVELIGANTDAQRVSSAQETMADDEVTRIAGLPVTTRARTAFDLGRHLLRDDAVARLDALMRATAFSHEDVLLLAERYRGARGLQALTNCATAGRRWCGIAKGDLAAPAVHRRGIATADDTDPDSRGELPCDPLGGHGLGGIHGGFGVRRGSPPKRPQGLHQGHPRAAYGQKPRVDRRSGDQGGQRGRDRQACLGRNGFARMDAQGSTAVSVRLHFLCGALALSHNNCSLDTDLKRGGGRPGVRDAAARPRRGPTAPSRRRRGSAGGRRAPGCGPGTGHASTSR